MGYFSNGTEGDEFEARQCSKCVHNVDDGCPVMGAHILFAYELVDKKDHPGKVMLDMLIPSSKDGPWNDDCRMFVDASRLVQK